MIFTWSKNRRRQIFIGVIFILSIVFVGSSSTLFSAEPSKKYGGKTLAEYAEKYAGMTIHVIEDEATPSLSIVHLIPEFEKRTGIKVDYSVYAEETSRDKMVLDYISHTGTYDIAKIQWWFVPEYSGAGFIIPLDSYIENKSIPGLLNMDDLYDSQIETLWINGHQWAIPFHNIGGMCYYREDIFDKYGWTVPKTISEVTGLLDKFEAIKKQGDYEKMTGWVARAGKDFNAFGSLAGWAWAYGSKLLDDANKPTLLSDPGWEQAMNTWVNFSRDHGPVGAANIIWYDAYNIFMKGGSLMFADTNDYGADLTNPEISKVADKVGFAIPQKGPAGNHWQWFYGAGYGINNDISEQRKEAAWLFVQWRCSTETQLKEAQQKKVGRRFDLTSRKAQESAEFFEAAMEAGAGKYAHVFIETCKVADGSYWPFVPEFAEISEAVAVQTSAALAGMCTPKEALTEANSEVYRILEKAGYY